MKRKVSYKAYLKDRNFIVKVTSINFDSKHINYHDGQYSREYPPSKLYEFAWFEDIELMEYTGLKDIKGKKIYTGHKDSKGRYVEYRNGAYHLVLPSGQTYDLLCFIKDFKIKGTIYEINS